MASSLSSLVCEGGLPCSHPETPLFLALFASGSPTPSGQVPGHLPLAENLSMLNWELACASFVLLDKRYLAPKLYNLKAKRFPGKYELVFDRPPNKWYQKHAPKSPLSIAYSAHGLSVR